MEQEKNVQKILKSYKNAIYFAYGASALALILGIAGVSEGLLTDFIAYLFFAIIINIFKNKVTALTTVILSAIQFIFVIISILAGASQGVEILFSAVVFYNLFTFYKMIKPIGSIKKLNLQHGNSK
jgi:hypothetical protein